MKIGLVSKNQTELETKKFILKKVLSAFLYKSATEQKKASTTTDEDSRAFFF